MGHVKTEVKIAEFKSKLSKYLRSVQRGNEIVVKDRETPIARVVPYTPPHTRLVVRRPTKSLKEVEKLLRQSTPANLAPGDLDEALRWVRRDKYEA